MKYLMLVAAFFAVSFAYAHPYISRVWEFCPAPGQFINDMPEYEEGDDAEDMRLKAEELIASDTKGMISLGGWGGYVVFGFDHMIVNVAEARDFIVWGNAFYDQQGHTLDGRPGGSCEPGIVMVSYDANGNGKPDDEWYELAGSEYTNPNTIHDYSITYTRPANEKGDIPWQDNKGNSGVITHLDAFHAQPYYPKWIESGTMQFTGARLPDNYVDELGNGMLYVLYSYPFGYADNHPNTNTQAQLDIAWAVKADGQPANLPGIHFVKVYNGLNQQCGWLGETSTEICGAEDLHPDAPTGIDQTSQEPKANSQKLFRNGQLYILRGNQTYTITGTIINN